MFRYKSIREQLREERKANESLRSRQQKNNSDIEYIAMMTDVELETDEEEVHGDEQEI